MKLRLLALFCAFMASAATAVEVPSLFTAEVPFDRSEPDARQRAYSAALASVAESARGPITMPLPPEASVGLSTISSSRSST